MERGGGREKRRETWLQSTNPHEIVPRPMEYSLLLSLTPPPPPSSTPSFCVSLSLPPSCSRSLFHRTAMHARSLWRYIKRVISFAQAGKRQGGGRCHEQRKATPARCVRPARARVHVFVYGLVFFTSGCGSLKLVGEGTGECIELDHGVTIHGERQ